MSQGGLLPPRPAAGAGQSRVDLDGRSIRRRFVRVGPRHVHVRHAGSGPALLLIHQSPQNSRMWLPLMAHLADRYTVIAPDTPGFGHSDPLPGEPAGIAEFGAATLAFADALGLQRFAVAGMHTGALIATWLAWARPDRVSALVADGYAAFTPEESALFGEAYLPPFVPRWDGSHLRWLWARMREQKYFFPWYDGRAAAAMAIAPHTTASTHAAVMDVLDVGDHYRTAYAAAFRHNDHHWVRELRVPAWMAYRQGDPLLAHLPRLAGAPDGVEVVRLDGEAALHAAMDQWLGQALAGEPPCTALAEPSGAQRDPGAEWSRRLAATSVGDLAVWQRAGSGSLTVRLHAPGEYPGVPSTIATGIGAWLLPDLPGHGASCEIQAGLGHDTVVAGVLEAVAGCGIDLPIVLHTHGAAAAYAPALVQGLGARVQELVVHSPWLLREDEQALLLDGLPATTIDRAGGHLGDAWQWERERHLAWPWMATGAAARRPEDAPDPATVHANVVELLRLGPRLRTLLREATPPGLPQRLRALPVPVRVVAAPGSDYQGRAAALSADYKDSR